MHLKKPSLNLLHIAQVKSRQKTGDALPIFGQSAVIAAQVNVLSVGAKRAEHSREDKLGRGVLEPSNGGKLLDLQHAEHLALNVDDIWHNVGFQRGDFAEIIDECERRGQVSMSVRRQAVERSVATAKSK